MNIVLHVMEPCRRLLLFILSEVYHPLGWHPLAKGFAKIGKHAGSYSIVREFTDAIPSDAL